MKFSYDTNYLETTIKLFPQDFSNTATMKIKFLLLTLILNLICHCVFGQEPSIIRADQKYKDLAYFEAISIYEKVAKKGYQSVELFERLGNCYYFNSDFETAAKWYEQLFNLSQDIEKEYYYRFAQSLKSAGKYDKAKKFLDGFVQKNENDKRALLLKNNNEYLNKIELKIYYNDNIIIYMID